MATKATLVHVREVEDDNVEREVTTVQGDGHRWFELPGKNAAEVEKALLDAGFVLRHGPQSTRLG